MYPAVCTQLYNNQANRQILISYLNLAFTISAPVNGGKCDWFIRAQILQMEMTVYTLCSVKYGGLCKVEVALTILKLSIGMHAHPKIGGKYRDACSCNKKFVHFSSGL